MKIPTMKTMNSVWIVFGILVLCAAFFLLIVWKKSRTRRLSPATRIALVKEWKKVEVTGDAHRAILDAEKIIDHALKDLGYTGTFADKLRAASPRFSSVQAVWNAHKLRNRIAHEVGFKVSDQEAKKALFAFERALRDLC